MKNNIIIFCTKLVLISLLIISYSSCHKTVQTDETETPKSSDLTLVHSNMELTNTKKIPDLYFGVDTRFAAVKKSNIDKATTIYAFLNEGEKQQIAFVNSVDIIIIKDNQQSNIHEYGKSDQLTNEQMNLLKSTEYFDHFKIKTVFKEINKETGKLEERFFSPHITVVPDKQATYSNGKVTIIDYLKVNSLDNMNVIKDNKLGSTKLYFTITKEGTISNVYQELMVTGYPSIDEKFIELIKNMPGKWTPAENANGEKMDQEFVFTFGPRDDC